MNLEKYKAIIFDFDGVIVDSNNIKKDAIYKAVDEVIPEKRDEFVDYFIQNNGLPRETKIFKYFDKSDGSEILDKYNNFLKDMFLNVNLTEGFQKFFSLLKFYKINAYIVSGGEKEEIKNILENKNILNNFVEIKSAPKTKEENIASLNLKANETLFFGDSLIDYKAAKKYNIDFVFMYKYSQFKNWKEYFKVDRTIIIIKDFNTLINYKCLRKVKDG